MMYTRTFRLLPCRQKLVTLQLTRSVSCFSTRKCPGGIYSRSPPTDRYISVSAALREGEKASSSSPTQDEVGSLIGTALPPIEELKSLDADEQRRTVQEYVQRH